MAAHASGGVEHLLRRGAAPELLAGRAGQLGQPVRGEPGGAADRAAARRAVDRPVAAPVAADAGGEALLPGLPGDRRPLPRARGSGAAAAGPVRLHGAAGVDLLRRTPRSRPLRRPVSRGGARRPRRHRVHAPGRDPDAHPERSVGRRAAGVRHAGTRPGGGAVAAAGDGRRLPAGPPVRAPDDGDRTAGADRRRVRDVRPRPPGAARDRPLPAAARGRGGRRRRVRHHREHQAGGGGRRRDRDSPGADPAARSGAPDAGGRAAGQAGRRSGVRASPEHRPPTSG